MKTADCDKLLQQIQAPEEPLVWSTQLLSEALHGSSDAASTKATERLIQASTISFEVISADKLVDEHGRPAKRSVLSQLVELAKKKRKLVLFMSELRISDELRLLVFNDARSGRRWLRYPESNSSTESLRMALALLSDHEKKDVVLLPSGPIVESLRALVYQNSSCNLIQQASGQLRIALEIYSHGHSEIELTANTSRKPQKQARLTHLDRLEAESIHIIREVMAESENPGMLYSVGKDSSVMLHLARKAFYPSPPPFPLLHVDTRWKFQSMYDFRDYMAKESGMELLVHINQDGVAQNINPLDHGSALHTDIMKTQSLKQALDHYKFDVTFGGARRDEEKSRAKERVFSFRTSAHRWDPKNQRPELWNLYNGKKNPTESIRVFPISNWTELDIWQYIYREQIPIVPLYLAAERPVVERDGMLIMVDDDRLTIYPEEDIKIKKIRFRTLGCYPLTGAIESEADDLASIVLELLNAKTSERQGRAIDSDSTASMEKRKQEGYF